jgi:hypothetical protein
MRQLGVRHLQLGALTDKNGPVLAPVERKASPEEKINGTNVPRPLVCCSRWRSAFHDRTKSATQP